MFSLHDALPIYQVRASRLVDGGHATQIGCHVGKHKIDRGTIQRVFQLFEHGFLAEVAADELDAADALHRQDVQRDHPALVAESLARDLRPAAGSRAEVHHHHARLEQAVALDQLLQLEHRARTPAFGLCTLDVGIAEVFPQPAGARFAARHRPMPRRNATSHLWKARAVARPCEGLAYGLHDTLWQPRGAAPPVQIRFPFMPARKAPSKPASRRPASTGARARPAAPPRKKPRSVREAAVAPAAPLNANQKRYLRSLAHDLKAVILIGQKGVTE